MLTGTILKFIKSPWNLWNFSSDSSDEEEMSEEEMKRMLKKHKQMKKIREKTRQQPVRADFLGAFKDKITVIFVLSTWKSLPKSRTLQWKLRLLQYKFMKVWLMDDDRFSNC